jgi:dienelactone hydrolase
MKIPELVFTRLCLVVVFACSGAPALFAQPEILKKASTDRAAEMVQGIDDYLAEQLTLSLARRQSLWNLDYSSLEAFARSVQPNRDDLRRILGVVDQRLPVKDLEHIASRGVPALIAEGSSYRVYAVRWPVLEGVDAEGLLLDPKGSAVACVVALPDADWSPEMLAGLSPGLPEKAQFARRLAENGCRVIVPTLIDRSDTWSGNPRHRMTNQPHREFIYRMAYEMGRHVIGYEVQKVLSAVDWFSQAKDRLSVGVFGYGEGGLLALYSGALDPRIDAVAVSGYFGPRERMWSEPIYRNVWAFLREFGDAELARLVAPRVLIVESSRGPEVAGPPPARNGRSGAAPGKLTSPHPSQVAQEWERALECYRRLHLLDEASPRAVLSPTSDGLPGADKTLGCFLTKLAGSTEIRPDGKLLVDTRQDFDPRQRLHRQFDQLCAFTQRLMREGEFRRKEFWSKADPGSAERWRASCSSYRDYFWEEVIGKLPPPKLPLLAEMRPTYHEPKWEGCEVKIDLYPRVFALGVLLVPKGLKPGERRPVVVCQHGLEGRPEDVVNPRIKTPYYNSFGAQLADRGYVVYAPQNPYIGKDAFRVLQRKANPLKLSLFSFIVRQHERTLDWLAGLPFVDPKRIAFYGLSYGGKTAMRVPALLERYALSICSADFNEWIWKNVSQDHTFSYMFTGEYEMYEFNLGNTFNYAEMAWLIAPRPFMVERGHDDGVGIDEWVAYEYAKVRRLYAKLGLLDRTAIEFFPGGHMINGKGTFAFLDKHLHWPETSVSSH